jgi:outer membrane protein assembly factor BamB
MHHRRTWFIIIVALTLTSCTSTQSSSPSPAPTIFSVGVEELPSRTMQSSLIVLNGEGHQLWQTKTPGVSYARIWGKVNDITLVSYFGSENRNILFGMSARSGHVIWQTHLTSGVSDLHIAGNVAYLIDGDGNSINALIALTISTGKILWKQAAIYHAGEIQVGANIIYFVASPSPGGPPSCPTFTSSIEAVSAHDGHILWKHTQSTGIRQLVVDVNDTLYQSAFSSDCLQVDTYTATITALNSGTGNVKWSQPLNTFPGSMQVANGHLFVTSAVNGLIQSLFALDDADGHLLWRYDYTGFLSLLTIGTGVIYANNEQNGDRASPKVLAFDSNSGKELWSTPLSGKLAFNFTEQNDFGPPILADGHLFDISIVDSSQGTLGNLVSLQPQTGARIWQTSTPMSVGNQNIFLTWLRGKLYMAYNTQINPQTAQGAIQSMSEDDGHVFWHQMLSDEIAITYFAS